MKIAIIGSRGIPANYGGFETFAEELAVNLVKQYDHKVTVVCDLDQQAHNKDIEELNGVELRYSKYSKSKNALLFYLDSVRKVAADHDIVYSCGPAGGMFAPLAHRKGSIFITNPDGLNWKREKWSPMIQRGFRMFESLASRFSDYMACDSLGIEKHIRETYGIDTTFVAEYGSYPNTYVGADNEETGAILDKYGLKKHGYHLIVSRLEPENHVHLEIEGYAREKRQYPLAVVGNLNETGYVEKLQQMANADVRFLGGIYNNKELEVVRANALDYLHGHSVGGTNPSLLEAMGSKNLCICHDNPFNREVVGEHGIYFSTSDQVADAIAKVEADPAAFGELREGVYRRILDYYNWDEITRKYSEAFEKIMTAKRGA